MYVNCVLNFSDIFHMKHEVSRVAYMDASFIYNFY